MKSKKTKLKFNTKPFSGENSAEPEQAKGGAIEVPEVSDSPSGEDKAAHSEHGHSSSHHRHRRAKNTEVAMQEALEISRLMGDDVSARAHSRQESSEKTENLINEELITQAEKHRGSHSHGTSSSGSHSSHRKKRSKHHHSHTSRKKKRAAIILGVILGILLALAVTMAALYFGGADFFKKTNSDITIDVPDSAEVDGDVVTYNGKRYKYNPNILTILLMGVDKTEFSADKKLAGQGGQADTLMLLAVDTVTGKTKVFNISRDSMEKIDRYTASGEYFDTVEAQICLAYAYGDGKKGSCENTAKAVSRMFYGMPVNAYASLDLSGIPVINDRIGGVTVTVLEDMTQFDSRMKVGRSVTLYGKSATLYLRHRNAYNFSSNNSRMQRQMQYVTEFAKQVLNATKKDLTLPLKLYDTASDYAVTSVDSSQLTYLVPLALRSNFNGEQDIWNVPGKTTLVDGFARYTVDETALYEKILEVFFTEIK